LGQILHDQHPGRPCRVTLELGICADEYPRTRRTCARECREREMGKEREQTELKRINEKL
jgi:hypothetical protein